MASTSFRSPSASVIDLAGFRCINKSNNVLSPNHEAELMSIRRHLSYQASVEIDNLDWFHKEFGEAFCLSLVNQVRNILNKEYGKLRVHRYKRLFVIRHRSVEGLISSLLRIQFHAHQLELPMVNESGKPSNVKPVTLTWGVGRTTSEAEVERLRRRRQKFKR